MNQKGLRRIFFEWQIKLLEYFWEKQEPMVSRAVWKQLHDAGVKASMRAYSPVSRASVIYFLNDLVENSIMTYTEGTGKGGIHRIYSLAPYAETKEKLKEYIFERFTTALVDFLEE